MRASIVSLIVAILICFGAAAVGSFFTAKSVSTWYVTLNKPTWNPPGWLFGPVWTILYLMMATSIWLIWSKFTFKDYPVIYSIFSLQLILNVLWSGIFFGLRQPGWAVMDIAVLWLLILLYVLLTWPVSKAASLLFVPYLLWVGFAGVLNFTIWRLNKF
ncbi:MAG TPA: TspO/MBR family protein [Balneolales bacterium]|nr:TspO/MBR family protein [Balneolales bacterium]